jgi:predicted dehydrogenase
MAALEAGKHVLCEKPVNHDYREVERAADLAASKGLKTKLGFTFRYAPATMYAAELISQGFIGTPYVLNAYEQNSQWLDPSTPLRQQNDDTDPDVIQVASIEGYGAPVIDIMHWWLDAPLTSVVGTMRNFVPERIVRDTGRLTRMNIDDGDMFIAEFAGGALASVQSSFVTVGNYPGIEVRIYGSEGALILRLVEEEGICQTLKAATKDSVEFKELDIPNRFFPRGGSSREPWPFLFYSNLVANFATEILSGGPENQGDFRQGALVQQTVNAFEASHRQRAWVDFPFTPDA